MLLVNIVKISALCLSVLFSTSRATETTTAHYSIVFVHLGNTFPNYLIDAVEQARLFNKNANVIVLANQQALHQNPHKQSFTANNISEIACESLTPSESLKIFQRKSTLDKSFRDGFWQKATERFFYLDELIREHNLKNVFHLESDVLLYTDLSILLPVFIKHYPQIGAVFESDARCIPSLIFIQDQNTFSSFARFVAEHSHKGVNDMHMIADYKRTYGGIGQLPVIPEQYQRTHLLRNTLGQQAQQPSAFSQHVNEFQSLFDGASYGQYIGGIDPRNGKSQPGFINESAFFNPSFFEYEWIKDSEGRLVPHIIFGGKKYRINNLHMHSKNLKPYRSVKDNS